MRHDPASAAVEVMLRGLKMYGMAQAVSDLIAQGAPAFDAAVPILSQLHRGEFVDGADNVVLIGGPGTGKTHMATALASRQRNTTAGRPDSSPSSIWSTRSNRKRP